MSQSAQSLKSYLAFHHAACSYLFLDELHSAINLCDRRNNKCLNNNSAAKGELEKVYLSAS